MKKRRRIINREDVIQEIKMQNLLDLYFLFPELSGKRVKRCGHFFKILCPFHKEKRHSLGYVPVRVLWHCWGCGESGSIIEYYMKRKKVFFQKAVIDLAKIFKIKIQWENIS